MISILITFQLLDLLTTHLALKRGGFKEVNGLLAPLFDRFGPLPVLIAFKGTVIALLLLVDIPYEVLVGLVGLLINLDLMSGIVGRELHGLACASTPGPEAICGSSFQ